MAVNQKGELVVEEILYLGLTRINEDELHEIVDLILEHLQLRAVRTNATKHGNTEIRLEPVS